MKNLIEALNIFLKYADLRNPTHCEHDQLTIMGIQPVDVSNADRERLANLGFEADEDEEYFYSYRYGSA